MLRNVFSVNVDYSVHPAPSLRPWYLCYSPAEIYGTRLSYPFVTNPGRLLSSIVKRKWENPARA